MFVLLFVCNVISAYGFVLRGTYNITFKDNVDHKIDLVLNDEDYEMIHEDQLKELNLDKKLFSALDKIASIEYNDTILKSNVINFIEKEISTGPTRVQRLDKKSEFKITTTSFALIKKAITKNKAIMAYRGYHSTHAPKKKEITKSNEPEYNYNELLYEYYEQVDSNVFENTSQTEAPEYGVMHSFKRIFLPSKGNYNYNKSIGFLALKRLMDDYRKQRCPTNEIVRRLWRIIQIWFLVYLIFAVPLWCTRGWCCCCLFCKCFKPHPTIMEAKKYIIINPPGVFKTKNGEVHYDPTDREKEAYEEFDHFLKTN